MRLTSFFVTPAMRPLMAKQYFYYSAMNAGKTTVLLKFAHNYRERGMPPRLFTPVVADCCEGGVIHFRIGLV
jgi:thymidine kinase